MDRYLPKRSYVNSLRVRQRGGTIADGLVATLFALLLSITGSLRDGESLVPNGPASSGRLGEDPTADRLRGTHSYDICRPLHSRAPCSLRRSRGWWCASQSLAPRLSARSPCWPFGIQTNVDKTPKKKHCRQNRRASSARSPSSLSGSPVAGDRVSASACS